MKLRHLLIIALLSLPLCTFAGNFSVGYTGFFTNFDGLSMDHKIDAFYKMDMGLYFGPEIKYFVHDSSGAYAVMAGYTHPIGNTKVMPYVEMGYSWVDSVQSLVAEKQDQFQYDMGIHIPLLWGMRLQYEIDQLFDHAKVAQYTRLHYNVNPHVDINIGAAWGQGNAFGHYTTPLLGFNYIF